MNNKKMRIGNAGITLIELLVVVAVVGVLSSVGINTYQTAQKKARRVQCLNLLNICFKLEDLYQSSENKYTNIFTLLDPSCNVNCGKNFPDTTKTLYYDLGLKAEGSAVVVAENTIDYCNVFNSNGQLLTPCQLNRVALFGKVVDPNPPVGDFRCACKGNIDSDFADERLSIDKFNKLTIHWDDILLTNNEPE